MGSGLSDLAHCVPCNCQGATDLRAGIKNLSELEAETTRQVDGADAGLPGTKLNVARPTLHHLPWREELFQSTNPKGHQTNAHASPIAVDKNDGVCPLDGIQDGTNSRNHSNHSNQKHDDDNDNNDSNDNNDNNRIVNKSTVKDKCSSNDVGNSNTNRGNQKICNDNAHDKTGTKNDLKDAVKHIKTDPKKKGRKETLPEEGWSSEPVSPTYLLEKPMHRKPSLSMLKDIVNLRDLNSCYKLDKEVGRGSFAVVVKGYRRVTNAVRAIKCMSKQRMLGKEHHLDKEIDLLKNVDHPNVVKLYELFEDSDSIYMVMEMCFGGTLLDYVRKGGHIHEGHSANVMLQLLRAVFYLHGNHICHRDIKPANCLLVNKGTLNSNFLKLSDLGLACRFKPGQVLKHSVGTMTYMAPEVFDKHYDCKCDLWSCGVLLFKILSGYEPFASKTDDETRENIVTGKFTFSPSQWVHVSEDAMSLVQGLLRVTVNDRYTVAKALNHPWMKKKAVEVASVVVDEELLMSLRTFRSLGLFKRSALQVIASMLSDDKLIASKQAFFAFDKHGDGRISPTELSTRLQVAEGASANLVELDFFQESGCDTKLKEFTYTEFLAATFDRKRYCQREVCFAAFSWFDVDGDGSLSVEDLTKSLGLFTPDKADQILRNFDNNGDGVIDFDEFLEMMQDGQGWSPRSSPAAASTCAWTGSGSYISTTASTSTFSRGGSASSTTTFNQEISPRSSTPSEPMSPTSVPPWNERRREKERPKSYMMRRLSFSR